MKEAEEIYDFIHGDKSENPYLYKHQVITAMKIYGEQCRQSGFDAARETRNPKNFYEGYSLATGARHEIVAYTDYEALKKEKPLV